MTPASDSRPARPATGRRSTSSTGSFSRGRCTCPAENPPSATASDCETCSAEMPLSAAFVRSTAKVTFSWSSSTNQSTSTTPSVPSKMPRICLAISRRRTGSGP